MLLVTITSLGVLFSERDGLLNTLTSITFLGIVISLETGLNKSSLSKLIDTRVFSLHQTSVLIIPLDQLSDS